MNVIIPAWGSYSGFKWAALSAATYAGCPVHVIGEASLGVGTFYQIADFIEANEVRKKLVSLLGEHADYYATGIARWFVVREFLERKIVEPPVFIGDWDVLVFSNLQQAFRKFHYMDYMMFRDCYSNRTTAPIFLNRIEPVNAFCDLVHSMVRHKAPALVDASDMVVWESIDRTYDWAYSDLSNRLLKTTWDHHMGHDQGRFKMRDGSKVLRWRGGKPHFVTRWLGTEIRTHTIHCWGNYKNREQELYERSRLP